MTQYSKSLSTKTIQTHRCLSPLIRMFSILLSLTMLMIMMTGCSSASDSTEEGGSKEIRLIVTSDIHGRMLPWNYIENIEDTSGSLAQAATIIKEKRNDHTILVETGDMIQDNNADQFLNEPVHPMILGMNAMGYDVVTVGNHEFNYGMDILQDTMDDIDAPVILCNVYDPEGKRIADPYVIIECDGIRIGFIGAVTSGITNWDRDNLKGYTVTDPADEVRKIIDEIKDDTDLLVGLLHIDNQGDGASFEDGYDDVLAQCPELDFICAGHGHREVIETIDNTPLVENKAYGQTVMVADLSLEKQDGKWHLADTAAECIHASDYEPDDEITELLAPYDKLAKQDAERIIGTLEGGDLADDSQIPGIPDKLIKDTPLMDFQAEIFEYYSHADVVAVSPNKLNEVIKKGKIRKCDISNIKKFSNPLNLLEMTGKQLRKWMEWTAAYYVQSGPDDLTVAFKEDRSIYTFSTFSGIHYEINTLKPEGERIENLTWPDGSPVKDDDTFTVAVCDYMVTTYLSEPGEIYASDDELPTVIDRNYRGDIGDMRGLIIDYISNVRKGTVEPVYHENWKLTGIETDEQTVNRISQLVQEGKLDIGNTEDLWYYNRYPVTKDMLEKSMLSLSSTK